MWLDDISATLMGSKSFELEIDATLPEVVEQLERNVDTGMAAFRPGTGLAGRIEPPSVTIHYRHVMFANAWRPVFRGTLDERPSGVRLTGRYTLMRGTAALMVFQVGFVVVGALVVFLSQLVEGSLLGALGGLTALLGFGVLATVFQAACVGLGRAEIQRLKYRLIDAVYD